MATPIEGINTPISTPAEAAVERNSRGCLTKCPECGASLSSANSAAATSSLTPEVAVPGPAPAKKGLLGLGFLGLGGRRRRTQRRRAMKRRGSRRAPRSRRNKH